MIMGIKTSSARLLAYLKRAGESDLRSVCMFGRQELCLTQGQIRAFCKDYKDVLENEFQKENFCENSNYSGPPVPEALPTGPRLTGESQ